VAGELGRTGAASNVQGETFEKNGIYLGVLNFSWGWKKNPCQGDRQR